MHLFYVKAPTRRGRGSSSGCCGSGRRQERLRGRARAGRRHQLQGQPHQRAARPPIPKTPEVAAWLPTIEYSATSLDAYLQCPLKFYYKTVLRLSPREELSGEIESMEIGTFVHAVLFSYFEGRTGRPLTAEDADPDAMTRGRGLPFSSSVSVPRRRVQTGSCATR